MDCQKIKEMYELSCGTQIAPDFLNPIYPVVYQMRQHNCLKLMKLLHEYCKVEKINKCKEFKE